MNIDELQLGRELDAMVNVHIFGGTCARCEKGPASHIENSVVYCSPDCAERISDYALDDYELRREPYSTDIAAAWRVVEKMREVAGFFDISGDDTGSCWAAFRDIEISAETIPLAICRAALAALLSVQPTEI